MIAVKVEGRLGNQLFQYAFIYASSKKLNTSFYIDQYNEQFILNKYFKNLDHIPGNVITMLFSISGFKNIFNFHLRRLYYNYKSQLYQLVVKQYSWRINPVEVKLQNNTLYEGYFQSASFFKSFEETIRDKFSLRNKFIAQFKAKYNNLYKNNTIVTIHIRRADYLDLKHLNLSATDLSLPINYYKKIIKKFHNQNVHFIFISDDVPFVEENFGYVSNKTISTDTEVIDFQHLLNADVCIIANSTFSWWGAWLNNKPNKIIYAPRYFMGWCLKQETPIEIYPDNWIQIEV